MDTSKRYQEPTWHGRPIPFRYPTTAEIEAADREKARQKAELKKRRAQEAARAGGGGE